jgi:hypothetical protein
MKSGPAILHLVFLLLCSLAAPCEPTAVNEVADRIAAYLTSFAASGNFSGAVLVARRGQVLFRRAYEDGEL